MYNLQLIEDRIMSIASVKNLSKNKLLINAGLNKSIFDNMKKGQIPSVDKIHKIADYLNVSVDYLLGRTENPDLHKTGKVIHTSFEANKANILQNVASKKTKEIKRKQKT